MADVDPILEKLRQKRVALAKLDRERETLLVEIRTLDDVVRMLDPERVGASNPDANEGVQRRGRGLSGHWKSILAQIAADYPKTYSYEDIEVAAEIAGRPMEKATLRKVMMEYVNKELIDRISDGQFRMNPKGAAEIGVALGRGEIPDVAASETPPSNGANFVHETPSKAGQGTHSLHSRPVARGLLSSAATPFDPTPFIPKGG